MSDRALVIGLDAYEHQEAWELRLRCATLSPLRNG